MGVEGLLNFVKSTRQQVHVSAFKGETVAVDASAWLHRGLFTCALEVLTGQSTDRFLELPLRLVAMMQQHGVHPLLVFDGATLPLKHGTGRSRARATNLDKGVELLKAGRETEAKAALGKAVSVAPWMATLLIEQLRRLDVPFVVAPYEADPQLAFLVREGHCAAAISEDSDLLAYGCPRTLYKLDAEAGTGELIDLEDLRSAEGPKGHLFDGTWAGEWEAWRGGLFTDLCILSGTDYLSSLHGVGIKTAHTGLRKWKELARALRSNPLKAQAKLSEEDLKSYLEHAELVRPVSLVRLIRLVRPVSLIRLIRLVSLIRLVRAVSLIILVSLVRLIRPVSPIRLVSLPMVRDQEGMTGLATPPASVG